MDLSNRRSIRLRGYDYALNGAYYITICAFKKQKLFGEIRNSVMHISDIGLVVQNEWYKTAEIRSYVTLDEFIIMPNHIHGIILIENPDNVKLQLHAENDRRIYPNTLGSIIMNFKAAVTKRSRELLDNPSFTIWQSRYYDHIIRNEDDLNHCREYIRQNPANWNKDEMFIEK